MGTGFLYAGTVSVRATRLLAILETLRGRRGTLSAEDLAERHGVSTRTIYRDIASLRGQGANIEGESGVGYRLAPGFILPPLSFSEEELEAMVLGIRWVVKQGDPALAEAAERSLARIFDTLPPKLRIAMDTCGLFVPSCTSPAVEPWMSTLRCAIRNEQVLELEYRDLKGKVTQRRVWPFVIAFFQRVRLFGAWCELRQDFRSFRVDRVLSVEPCGERYPQRRHDLIAQWRRRIDVEGQQDPS